MSLLHLPTYNCNASNQRVAVVMDQNVLAGVTFPSFSIETYDTYRHINHPDYMVLRLATLEPL